MSDDGTVSFKLDNDDMVGLVRAGVSSGIDASLMFNCRISVVEPAANAGMTVPNSLVRSASCGSSLCHFAIGELVVRLLRFKTSLRMLASVSLRKALIFANSSRSSAAL